MINNELVKKLREETLAPFSDCLNALKEAEGDFEKAKDILKKKGLIKAEKKLSSETKAGLIEGYIHQGRVGVLVDLRAETDFVARNPDFKNLAHDLAMQIAALSPRYLKPEDIPPEEVEKLKNLYRDELKDSGKPAEIIEKIVEGRLLKDYESLCLYRQPFIKDETKKVEDIIKEAISKFGENIELKKFVRFDLE